MNNFDTELKERTAYVEKIVYDYCPKEEGLQKMKKRHIRLWQQWK